VLLRLLLLFIVVPLVELTLLLLLAEWTHWWVSLLVVIVTGVLGSMLAHRQGWLTFRRIQHELAHGQMPADSLLDALLILCAGALLLTPGLLTDLLGITLLLPPCRGFYKPRLVRWFKSRFTIVTSAGDVNSQPKQSQVIDSYVVETTSEDQDRAI
jgi:UPF0716 protein FxsA